MAGSGETAVAPRPPRRTAQTERLDVAAVAWLAALPCAAAAALAVAFLGHPLGALMAPPPGRYTFLRHALPWVHPEPTEHARYLIALAAPVALALTTAALARWQPGVIWRLAGRAAAAVPLLTAGLVVACTVAQYRLRYGEAYTKGTGGGTLTMRYFTPATLVAAGALAAAAFAAIRHPRLRALAATALREGRARRRLAIVAAIALTALWVLPGVYSDRSIAAAAEDVRFHVGFPLDEAFAVLNGRTPLVNFTAQYSALWPFLAAGVMLLLGKTLLAFTAMLCALTAVSLLAIFGVLRRVTRRTTAALLLYLPFLATSLYFMGGTSTNRSTVGTYFASFPLRYAGPYLLAWLTARELERDEARGGRGTGLLLLFVAGGLVVLNNADFGVAALGATLAALVVAAASPRRAIRRLAPRIALGLALAFALVSLLTLARAGSLPRLGSVVSYAGVYTVGGFLQMPIPGVLGLHLVIYLTYVAAIATAAVRVLGRAPNRPLTGMLLWSGVFGLGSASYYVGRSHPYALDSLFSGWTLALALLTVVVVRRLTLHPWRRSAIPAALVLLGFGVAACSLAQAPLPWQQVQRLTATPALNSEVPYPDPLVPPADPVVRRFVSSLADGPGRFVVEPGAPVAILLTTGHRIADAYGIVNVSPFTGTESIHTAQTVDEIIGALRTAGGNTVILPREVDAGIIDVLQRHGFRVVTREGLGDVDVARNVARHLVLMPWNGAAGVPGFTDALVKMVDTRHLHPRALR
jgi:hypothetical protein